MKCLGGVSVQQNRGARVSTPFETRELKTHEIPHFPLTDLIGQVP